MIRDWLYDGKPLAPSNTLSTVSEIFLIAHKLDISLLKDYIIETFTNNNEYRAIYEDKDGMQINANYWSCINTFYRGYSKEEQQERDFKMLLIERMIPGKNFAQLIMSIQQSGVLCEDLQKELFQTLQYARVGQS